MTSHVLRVALRASRVPQRGLSTTTVCSKNIVLDQKLRDEIYPKIGTREVVGYGHNGRATYVDRCEFPAPAIRYKEDTPEILKLKEKEKGDWKSLSLEEKKARRFLDIVSENAKPFYRASFGQTYSEMNAPTGEWKPILATVLFGLTVTGWIMFFMRKYVYQSPPTSLTREWQEKSLERMITQGQGAIQGVSAKWDYDKGEWKK